VLLLMGFFVVAEGSDMLTLMTIVVGGRSHQAAWVDV
jgi:hypothetical protein